MASAFWLGVLVGLWVGVSAGIVLAAFLSASSEERL
jgi:Na+/H+ antiporter NhaA